MSVEEWLRAAAESARTRDLPALIPMLQTLARATARLRQADAARRGTPEASEEP